MQPVRVRQVPLRLPFLTVDLQSAFIRSPAGARFYTNQHPTTGWNTQAFALVGPLSGVDRALRAG